MQLIFCAGHDFSDLCAWRRLDYHRAKLPVAGSFESLPKQWLAKMLGRVHTQLSKVTWHVSRRPWLSARLTFQVLICHKLFCPKASCWITAVILISWAFFFFFPSFYTCSNYFRRPSIYSHSRAAASITPAVTKTLSWLRARGTEGSFIYSDLSFLFFQVCILRTLI